MTEESNGNKKRYARACTVGLITLPLQGFVRRQKQRAEATTTKT